MKCEAEDAKKGVQAKKKKGFFGKVKDEISSNIYQASKKSSHAMFKK